MSEQSGMTDFRARSDRAINTFFIRVGQVGRVTERCAHTLPLFPLVLILEADGTLAADAAHLLDVAA